MRRHVLLRLLALRAKAKPRSYQTDGKDSIFDAAAKVSDGGVWPGDTFLYARSVAETTRRGYEREARRFIDFAVRENLPLTCALDLDIALSLFARFLFDEGYGAATGERLVSAAKFVWPVWAPDIRITSVCIDGWRKLRPSVKRVPISRAVATAIAMRLVLWGFPSAGALVLLAFHCYLRIGEFMATRCVDIIPSASDRIGLGNPKMFVSIPRAKTGPLQDVEVRDAGVEQIVLLAASAAGGLHSTQRLCQLSEYQFRRVFRAACDAWGLPADITPHSLRHGGATHDHSVERVNAKDIMIRGRWMREKSFAHYVGTMRSSMAMQKHPPETVRAGAEMARDLPFAFLSALALASGTDDTVRFRLALGW